MSDRSTKTASRISAEEALGRRDPGHVSDLDQIAEDAGATSQLVATLDTGER